MMDPPAPTDTTGTTYFPRLNVIGGHIDGVTSADDLLYTSDRDKTWTPLKAKIMP
jgi:hypothetical protein